MKSATVYGRNGKIYIHSSSKTTAGVWVINPPFFIIKEDDFQQIGRSLRECLAASSEGVPHPKYLSGLFDPVLKLAGVKSFNAFMKSAKCVEVEQDGETATLIPTRNEGAEDGFAPLPKKVQISGDEDDALGSAAIAVLALAE